MHPMPLLEQLGTRTSEHSPARHRMCGHLGVLLEALELSLTTLLTSFARFSRKALLNAAAFSAFSFISGSAAFAAAYSIQRASLRCVYRSCCVFLIKSLHCKDVYRSSSRVPGATVKIGIL